MTLRILSSVLTSGFRSFREIAKLSPTVLLPVSIIFVQVIRTGRVTVGVDMTNEWETSDKKGLVSIGSHALFVSTNGPVRRAGLPVIIFVTGGGAPTEMYTHLHAALSKHARNYFYDRTGYGRSESPSDGDEPQSPSDSEKSKLAQVLYSMIPTADDGGERQAHRIRAADSARELHQLMAAINVKPPYVLAAHSYGGIIARTFFALFPDDVAGMALLDNNTELLQQCLSPIPPKAYIEVTKDVDAISLLRLRERAKMTDQEWDALMAAVSRTVPGSSREATHESGRELARYMQIDRQAMGDRPLLLTGSDIVREWRLVLDKALGALDQRCEAEWWMESAELFWTQTQKVQLGLSTDATYYDFAGEGHYFPMTAPEQTARWVKSVLDRAEEWTCRAAGKAWWGWGFVPRRLRG